MSGIDIHQLAAAYSLDALDERERAAFEAHYPSCSICSPEVAGFRETLSQIAASVAVPPPASLKAGVMAEIGVTRQLSPLLPASVVDLAGHRQRRRVVVQLVGAAAAIALVVLGAFVLGQRSGDGNGYADAAAAVLSRPDTRMTNLSGDGTGSFRVAWSPSANKVVVMGDGLNDPGPGKAYELWLIDGAGPHAARLLDTAGGGQVRRVVAVDGAPSKWAVTVEPEAGVDQPTGDVIFVGTA